MKRKYFNRFAFGMRNSIATTWRENKSLLFLMGIFIIAGIIIGSIALFNPLVTHFQITRNFLDANVLNVITPNRGLFAFVLARFFDLAFALTLVFLFNLSKFSFWLTFPYVGFRAFWMVVNLFWIVDRFGFVHGSIFFFAYLVIFIILIIMFSLACIFIMKRCAQIRKFGWRSGCSFREIRHPLFWLTASILLIAFVEWLLYFLILGRMVYIA
ncbi:MAG: hypothetical protein FWE45_02075 [Firmicutes bacterium]|nr:hypothetical protein [Bacillota bacterium]